MSRTEPEPFMTELLERWTVARAELLELERLEHPDITDRFGRVWKWRKGDLYLHDQLGWPRRYVESCTSLPSPSLADNPNYDLCAICRSEWLAA